MRSRARKLRGKTTEMTADLTSGNAGADHGIPVALVVARERIDHPWQEYDWRPVEAIVPPPEAADWTMLRRTDTATHYLVGSARIELHRSEAEGYLENLSGEPPLLYVVLRPRDDGDRPLSVHLVSASPTEAQAYGHTGDEIIATIAMPQAVAEIVFAFAAEHHRPKPFVKRARTPHSRPEVHAFGQESIVELRRRMGLRNEQGGNGDEPGR